MFSKFQYAFYFFTIFFLADVMTAMRYFKNLVIIVEVSGQDRMTVISEANDAGICSS